MISGVIDLIAIKADVWAKEPLKALVEEAAVSERRIQKGSNLEIERLRYSQICKQIEDFALIFEDRISVQRLGQDYFDALENLQKAVNKDTRQVDLSKAARLGASFFPPKLIFKNIRALSDLVEQLGLSDNRDLQLRNKFIRKLGASESDREAEFGLVEVQKPFIDPVPMQLLNPVVNTKLPSRPHELMWTDNEDELISDGQEANISSEIEKAILQNRSVNFSNLTHIVITKILHKLVYSSSDRSFRDIRVVYNDGTEADPFPIASRPRSLNNQELSWPDLRASLVSMRHLEQDFEVDMAWFINQQASRPRSFAEADRFCYEQSLQLLDQLEKPARVHLYQTGLQPAVVGFYRALVHWMNQKSEHQIVVIPHFFHSATANYIAGDDWN